MCHSTEYEHLQPTHDPMCIGVGEHTECPLGELPPDDSEDASLHDFWMTGEF